MIKYRTLSSKMLSNEWFYKIDGTKFWYWSNNKWKLQRTKWTTAATKATKPISKSKLFLKLL